MNKIKTKLRQLLCNHISQPLEFITNLGDPRFTATYSLWKCPVCGKHIRRDYLFKQGEVSDGYHTFNELYHHRALLFATICNEHPEIAWKSKQHYNQKEKMYGTFVVGIDTPEGAATYHYNINPYWELFKVKELERAPKWDGHTSEEAIKRICSLQSYTKGETKNENK